MELYFSKYKQEKLSGSSYVTNSLVYIFVALDLIRELTNKRLVSDLILKITLAIFILIFGIVHRNARSISAPLEKLKEQTLAISDGKYDVQIEVTSKDEIGQLAKAFNYMATTISEEMEGRKQAEYA